jgi:pimeloyl-ACP methyl ester carboxylesterase
VEFWLSLASLRERDPLFPRLLANGRSTTAARRRRPVGRTAACRLTPHGIARTVQRAARRVGLDPARVAGHSSRSGVATEAAAQGAPERAIMAQTGPQRLEMVRGSSARPTRYRDNASSYLGL